MNEKARELIRKADNCCSETRAPFDHILVEMVVRECAAWIERTDPDPEVGYADAVSLLNHFGFEP